MEAKLKQRVLGAVVLTALAVIILPMLLDGSAEDRARITATIPEAPKIELKSLTILQVKQTMLKMEQESYAKLPVELPDEAVSTDEVFQLDLLDPKISLPAHLWEGEIQNFDAEVI